MSENKNELNFKQYYLGEFTNNDNAFNARLEYELNFIKKYDRKGMPSLPIPRSESLEVFAIKHGVSIEDMKNILPSVEKYLKINNLKG